MGLKSMPANSSAVFAGVAEEIEEAIASRSRDQLDSLQERLADDFLDIFREAPASVAAVVHGTGTSNSPEELAYALGKISFGQAVVAQAAERRAADCYVDTIHAPKFRKYIQALDQRDMSGVDLASFTGEDPATVSRKLKELRDLGIVEFRREGTRVVNFLTASAQAVYQSEPSSAPSALDNIIKMRASELDPHMQSATNFSLNE